MSRLAAFRSSLPSWRQAGMALLLGITLIWAGWATKAVMELQHRRIVTVRLASMMEDYVAREARAKRDPAEAQLRITTYLKGVQSVIDDLAKDGTTVLVAEAVISGAAPDYSPLVKTRVDLWMNSHDPR